MMAERGELAPARQIAAKAEADGFPPALSLRRLPNPSEFHTKQREFARDARCERCTIKFILQGYKESISHRKGNSA